MLDDQTKQRIIQQETSAFLDENFGGLDLSSFPSLNKPPAEEQFSPDGDRHGFNRVALPGANRLKEFTANPDSETLSRIAQETGNHELTEQLAEERATQVARDFVTQTPQYLQSDHNFDAIVSYLLKKHLNQSLRTYTDADEGSIALLNAGFWNLPELTAAFRALLRAGQLEVERGVAKALNQSEQLHVISLCKSGQLKDALSQYLSYSYPSAESDFEDLTEFLSDPATLATRNAACRFIWYHSRPVEDTPEWKQFEARWFRYRPIVTVADLDDCHSKFLELQRGEFRHRLVNGDDTPGNSSTPQQSIEDLSDEGVADLYRRVARERARTAPRTAGVIV